MSQVVHRLRFASVVAAVSAVAVLGIPSLAGAKFASTKVDTTFNAVGPAGMKIAGHTADGSVSEDGGKVTITVPLGNLTTGIALRDKHMKEKYLQVPTYPDAKLEIGRDALKLPGAGASSSGDASGTLKLHGQSKPVTVHYEAKQDGSGVHATGTFKVNMNDYGIETPSYLGVSVKPDVEVTVQVDATDK